MCRSVYVDFEKFKTETGLEDYDVKELYKGFMDELLDAKDKLLAQLDKDDFEKMEKTVHNIKEYPAVIWRIQFLHVPWN
jgi:HPt (histidine-containing phosphotransfer) domain-containing protein